MISLNKNKFLIGIFVLILTLSVTACSSSSQNKETVVSSSELKVAVDIPRVLTQAITDDFDLESVEINVINQADADDTQTKSKDITGETTAFSFNDLQDGASYDVEVSALDTAGYEVYTGSQEVAINGDSKVNVDLALTKANRLIVNTINVASDAEQGEVVLLADEKITKEIDLETGEAIFSDLAANDYTIIFKLFDSVGEEIVKKSGEVSIYPGRDSYTSDVSLAAGSNNYLDELDVTWEEPAAEVEVNASPAGEDFIDTTSVTLTVSGSEISTSRYTLDGSDPATTGTEYNDGDEINIGANMEPGETKTLKLYAEGATGEVTKEYAFNKISPSEHPMQLGAVYSPTETKFRIWSPDSSDVQVVIDGKTYDCKLNSNIEGYEGKDIYETVVEGDLHLKEYQFKIGGKAVRDPYGVMVEYDEELAAGGPDVGETYDENGVDVTANVGSNTNVVLDLNQTDINWSPRPELVEREDAVIYEMSIRDFTIDSTSGVTSSKQGKFLGAVEEGTTYNGVATGIDHLKELGITHVQILPFYDFATKYNHATGEIYNWGYDPVNYNVPEDRYSMNPEDYVARVKELKRMIDEFHENDIRVIMDVVYNHTFWDEMFENISPQYYDGQNLAGTGNSLDTGVPMVSRMIRDSLEYWVEEYNVDGFRFDLMGIYHYDEVRKWGEHLNDKYPNRNLLMYGEPWNGYADDEELNQKALPGNRPALASGHIGAFNGQFREAIKGGNDDATSGYMFNWNGDAHHNATTDNIVSGLRGSIMDYQSTNPLNDLWDYNSAYDPEQSINYISAHDNLGLWDKINYWADNSALDFTPSEDYLKRINRFGSSIVLTAQGIPFIHSGDELLRTKENGQFAEHAHNSYMWGDEVNKIDWSWKTDNDENANGVNDTFEFYEELIELRNQHPGLRLNTWNEINQYMSTNVPDDRGDIVITQIDADKNGDSWDEMLIVYNPGTDYTVDLPGSSSDWSKVFDATGADPEDQTAQCAGTAVTIFAK